MLTQFVVAGIGTGFIYVLFAVGMVLIYRESRVVSFAHGGFAAAGAYLFTSVYGAGRRPYALAVAVCVVVCAVLGLVTYQLVVRFLLSSDELTVAMATLGVLTFTIAAILWIFGATPRSVPLSFRGKGVAFGKLIVSYHSILVMIVGTVLCAGIALIVERTGVGRSIRAISEDRTIAGLLGIPVRRYDVAIWTLGGALAGFAGVMVTPTTGVTTTALVFLLVKGFAAALIGRFERLGLVVVGGLALGVMESLVIWKFQYVNGLREVLAFVLIAGALFLRDRERVIA